MIGMFACALRASADGAAPEQPRRAPACDRLHLRRHSRAWQPATGRQPRRGDARYRHGARPAAHAPVYGFLNAGFGDFAYNPLYARCMARHDTAGVALLERAWLRAAREEAIRRRDQARVLLGRDLPQVLLMHVGAFDARMLPRTIALYRSLGFRFVALAEAQADPFYAAANDLSLPGPSPTLDRLAADAGVADPAPSPTIDLGKLCR